MDKDIRFTGYTAVPSDYECTDGEVTQAHNLINEDGAYKSLLAPKVLINLGENNKVIFIHKTTSYTHYIVYNPTDGSIYWINNDDTGPTLNDRNKIGTYTELLGVNAIGNTLLLMTPTGMDYVLWANKTYTVLGNHLPNVEVSFGLKGYPKFYSSCPKSDTDATRIGEFEITFDKIATDSILNDFSDDNKTTITSQVMAKVNKFLAEETTEKGRFGLPFFVRYAFRLYDGTITCHSAPILMSPTTGPAPLVMVRSIDGSDGYYKTASCDIMLVPSTLDCKLLYDVDGEYADLSKWSDIIKSVDVFVSKPIYMHNQSGYCERFAKSEILNNSFVGAIQPSGISKGNKQDYIEASASKRFNDTRLYNIDIVDLDSGEAWEGGEALLEEVGIKDVYTEWPFEDLYVLYTKETASYSVTNVQLPELEDDETNKLKNISNFYLLSSIKLSDLIDNMSEDGRYDIEVSDDYLQSLTAREVMTDDYQSHDKLIPTFLNAYNSRLNMTGVERVPFNGFPVTSMFAHCTFACVYANPSGTARYWTTENEPKAAHTDIFVYIKENGEEYVVKSRNRLATADFLNSKNWGCYLFYPNVNAYRMRIEVYYTNGQSYYKDIELTAHDFLNGAYAVLPYGEERSGVEGTSPTLTDTTIPVLNKIYTSEVNNPFYFPVTGINTVGTGRILGISTAAKALSQGQFGQFPLYAFTDEGVWALEVSTTSGSYSAKQPITRDVCISSESITQIDSAVLFATDRGIMEISGSQTQCITDIINGDDFFALDRLPGLTKLYPDGIPQIDCTFAEYRKDARMAYDYINQRIVVFNASKSYAYVFSMKSKLWGIVASSLMSAINSYPDAYAMAKVDGNNCLVDLSRSADTSAKGLLVTRPIKLEAGSMLKTFDTVFLRGLFPKGKVQVVLYGSRDNINWHLIHSAKQHYLRGFRGSPYKYFRIVAITDLAVGETLLGASVQYTPRLTNQMR